MKVLYAGPDIKGVGGISSVLQSYSRVVDGFTYLSTNSRRGTVPGLVRFAFTLAELPYYRLRGFDIIHAHGASGKSFVRKRILLRWARILGFRTIFHCHGGAFDSYCENTGIRRMSRMLRSFSAIAVLSDRWQEYFAKTLGCTNVHVIPNIIEPPTEAVARKAKSDDSPLTFLFMGKICRDKGVYELLDAVALHRDELQHRAKVMICGNGEAEILKRRIEELGISDIASYGGVIPPEGRDAVYRSADVFILPSHIEGLPITLLEAASYCLPSIATPVGSIPSIVQPGVNGMLVEPGNPESIAAAMLAYVCDHDAVYRHGQAARRAIESNLPSSVLAKLQNLYLSIKYEVRGTK